MENEHFRDVKKSQRRRWCLRRKKTFREQQKKSNFETSSRPFESCSTRTNYVWNLFRHQLKYLINSFGRNRSWHRLNKAANANLSWINMKNLFADNSVDRRIRNEIRERERFHIKIHAQKFIIDFRRTIKSKWLSWNRLTTDTTSRFKIFCSVRSRLHHNLFLECRTRCIYAKIIV